MEKQLRGCYFSLPSGYMSEPRKQYSSTWRTFNLSCLTVSIWQPYLFLALCQIVFKHLTCHPGPSLADPSGPGLVGSVEKKQRSSGRYVTHYETCQQAQSFTVCVAAVFISGCFNPVWGHLRSCHMSLLTTVVVFQIYCMLEYLSECVPLIIVVAHAGCYCCFILFTYT